MNRQLGIRILIFIIFTLLLLYVHYSGIGLMFEQEKLKAIVASFGMFAPAAYMLFYVVASVFFIPGSPITLAGGALFGPIWGTVYTILGATSGAVLAFLFARSIGKNFVFFGTSALAQKLSAYDRKISTHGFVTVLFLRFVPLFPFNGLNFALGLTKVTFKDYFFGTLLGIIPGTFAYVYFGDSLASLDIYKILIGVGVIVLVSLLGKYIKAKYDAKE